MVERRNPRRQQTEAATRTILDSGAYSAYTRGQEIDADEYIRFCVRYQHCFSRIIVLDTIPPKSKQQKEKKRLKYDKGNFEQTTPEAAEIGARKSYAMWVRMRDAGIRNVTPVFHRFERFDWLERYLDEGADYICLGPGAYSSHAKKRDWLDECFSLLCDSDGYPEVDTHGLAVTSVELIMRYPWTSVDSASWAKRAGFGVVLVPKGRHIDGRYAYDKGAWSVAMSNISFEQSAGEDGTRLIYQNLSATNREFIREYLREVCGREYAQVAVSPFHRRLCNIIFFHKLSEVHNVERFIRAPELF